MYKKVFVENCMHNNFPHVYLCATVRRYGVTTKKLAR